MKPLKRIREKFGLSQCQMAEYLGVSRSIYSMVEIGQRQLPAAAYEKLIILSNLQGEPDPHEAHREAVNLRHTMMKEAKRCMQRAAALKRRLRKMNKLYNSGHRMLRACNALKSMGGILESWSHLNAMHATKTCQCNGPEAQALLTLRIRTLESEAEIALEIGRGKS